MPAISVVIPLYDKADFVARSVESALRQSRSDIEVVVVDDGSRDAGPDVVLRLAERDPRVRLVRRPNGGPGAARNTGLAASRGRYVAFLDADDELLEGFLEAAASVLDRLPECDIFAAAFLLGPERKNRWDELRRHGVEEGVWRLSADIPDDHLAYALAVFNCATLYRREAVQRFGGFYDEERCTLGEDVFLWLQLMLHCTVYRSFQVLAWYHTEASELGLSSARRDYPIEPVLAHADRIRDRCPRGLETVLERWLALHAIRGIHLCLEGGDRANARELLRRFPLIASFRRDYLKIRIKLAAPWLVSLVRRISRGRAR